MLQDIDRELGLIVNPDESRTGLSRMEIIKENMKDFKSVNNKSLFATRILARHTTLIWFIWLVIGKVSPFLTFAELKRSYKMAGIAYPLYFNFLPTYLSHKFTRSSSLDLTYRNYCIESAVGVVGPISASFAVNTHFGRR
jgi:hypothetical protein